jgi:hypothetical protein
MPAKDKQYRRAVKKMLHSRTYCYGEQSLDILVEIAKTLRSLFNPYPWGGPIDRIRKRYVGRYEEKPFSKKARRSTYWHQYTSSDPSDFVGSVSVTGGWRVDRFVLTYGKPITPKPFLTPKPKNRRKERKPHRRRK